VRITQLRRQEGRSIVGHGVKAVSRLPRHEHRTVPAYRQLSRGRRDPSRRRLLGWSTRFAVSHRPGPGPIALA
jgi:hypothetical protein